MNPNHHWKLFFINQPLFLCYLSVLIFHRSIKHFSTYFKRNVSIFHLRSEDVEVKTIFFAVEERRVVHRLETIWWSHADDDGDNGSNDNGENDDEWVAMREYLLKNGRWILLSYLPFLVPSQPGTGAGWGGAQRRDPTGGEAYGMDLPIFLDMIFKS